MIGVVILFLMLLFFLAVIESISKGNATYGNTNKKNRKIPFKKKYELDRNQSIKEFEKKMIAGMFEVNKEIFVAAFIKDDEVLNVTATIGGKYSCRASDNVEMWGAKATKIGANKIFQYHNHPDIFGRSIPSSKDYDSHRNLFQDLKYYRIEFKSFLVYKSWSNKPKIEEYK